MKMRENTKWERKDVKGGEGRKGRERERVL